MPETNRPDRRWLLVVLVAACCLAACTLDNLPQAAATAPVAERTPVPTPTPTTEQLPTRTPSWSSTPLVVAVQPTTAASCTVRTDWFAYTVAAGDTLFRIAQRSGSSVDALTRANCLSDPSQIQTGQRLYVPNPIGGPGEPTPAASGPVSYYLIIPADAGRSGPAVGCDDSVLRVDGGVPRTGDVSVDVRAALDILFIADPSTGGSGLVNSFTEQPLAVDSVRRDGQRLNVALRGTLTLVGVCADARLEAQLLRTIFDYPGFSEARITAGGQNVKQIFDASGLAAPDAVYTRAEAS